jgi:6-phosphogluconolactonase
MSPELQVHPTPQDVALALAARTADALRQALADHVRVSLCLTDGPVFEAAYAALAEHRDLAWDRVHLFWSHDRIVPPDHPESALGMARRALIEPLSIPEENVHPIAWDHPADVAARYYEADLEVFFGADGARFNVLHLRLGADGHTAALFPEAEALAQRSRRAIATAPTSDEPHDRVTLSLRVLSRAQQCYIVATGAETRAALASVLSGSPDERLPASHVRPDPVPLWLADAEAAAQVQASMA